MMNKQKNNGRLVPNEFICRFNFVLRRTPTMSSIRSNDSNAVVSELNETLSYLDSIEQLLLLTSASFNKLPTASFNNRVNISLFFSGILLFLSSYRNSHQDFSMHVNVICNILLFVY